jgi:hypothetical protein
LALMAAAETDPAACLVNLCLASATSLALASFAVTVKTSPALGTVLMPTICHSDEG